jgi:4-amino-4-deoxy-L-arabinose transferase-like glycosyltransferase
MKLSRPWLAFVLALFCLPLFIDLGRQDIQNDEAIYSFAVDRILEIGDWLAPRSSPHEDAVFLEKPPLKFWIVAAPIRVGLLPHNEFGIRFWDALFGGIGFAYVFAIGTRLAGPFCGGIAVLLLFVHWPLLFDHGLRQNNMEAPLFLCYCGGIYHYMAWMAGKRSRRDAFAVGLYFVLGFMTKFVAALFLPLVLAAATLPIRASRSKVFAEWRLWGAVSALVFVLVVPWFVYAHLRFGAYLWEVMLSTHVVTRFTDYLDPSHLQPWYYYIRDMHLNFVASRTEMLVVGGLVVLLVQTIRRRWFDGTLVLMWLVLPIILISLGTSKLYHYAYPFLPPLTLAAGYLLALIVLLVPAPFERLLAALETGATARLPGVMAMLRKRPARFVLMLISIAGIGLAISGIAYGTIRLDVDGMMLFKSSGVVRPIVVAVLAGLLAGAPAMASRAAVPLLVASILPWSTYHDTLLRLKTDRHPMRSSSECIARVQAQDAGLSPGIYLDLPDAVISHPMYYYFRRIQPWTRAASSSSPQIYQRVYEPQRAQPVLVWDQTYQQFMRDPESSAGPVTGSLAAPPMVGLIDALVLLPGPYAQCANVDAQASAR